MGTIDSLILYQYYFIDVYILSNLQYHAFELVRNCWIIFYYGIVTI
jgi:hypothetical protein